jgi:hypothetical protein
MAPFRRRAQSDERQISLSVKTLLIKSQGRYAPRVLGTAQKKDIQSCSGVRCETEMRTKALSRNQTVDAPFGRLPIRQAGRSGTGNALPYRRGDVVDQTFAASERVKLYCAKHPGSPSAVRRPQVLMRGQLWIALLGQNVERGIVGIGPTIEAALRDFDSQYLAGLRPPVHSQRTI